MSSTGASGVAMDRILVVPTRGSLGDYGRPVVAMQGHTPSYVARLGEATVSGPRRCAAGAPLTNPPLPATMNIAHPGVPHALPMVVLLSDPGRAASAARRRPETGRADHRGRRRQGG